MRVVGGAAGFPGNLFWLRGWTVEVDLAGFLVCGSVSLLLPWWRVCRPGFDFGGWMIWWGFRGALFCVGRFGVRGVVMVRGYWSGFAGFGIC